MYRIRWKVHIRTAPRKMQGSMAPRTIGALLTDTRRKPVKVATVVHDFVYVSSRKQATCFWVPVGRKDLHVSAVLCQLASVVLP
jgi:hypothetical protein